MKRSGDRCTECLVGKMKTRSVFTRGSRRVRYLICDTCRTTGKEVVAVDDIGRTIVAPVAWLKANSDAAPVGMADLSKKIAEAKERPLADVGPPTKDERDNPNNVRIKQHGNDNEYTLRRLARDAPAMLDKIESGELSVNAVGVATSSNQDDQQVRVQA